jgi:type 1 glutamine amidotransferase
MELPPLKSNTPAWNSNKVGVAILVTLVLVSLGAGVTLHCQTNSPIQVLITDGHSNHDWQRTTKIITAILKSTELFTVDVSTAPADAKDPAYAGWCPDFSRYDVVIQNYNDMGGGAVWPEPARHAFERFVADGGGLFILHSANNAFPSWEEYNKIIGLGWRSRAYGYALQIAADNSIVKIPPNAGASTSHGKRTDRVIHEIGNDPIHEGMPKSWMTPSIEVYRNARGPAENVELLSWAEEPTTQEHWPIEWTIQYGKGRVYNSTFGHAWRNEADPVDLRCVGFQTVLIRSLQWLAHRPVTWPVPKDFPTEQAVSLRPLPAL